jgi:mutator protein MutT
MSSPTCVEGVVAVIEHEGRLLAIQRAAHIVAGGHWCFPGGAIEAGETPEQAVIRETREEIGLAVTPVRELWQWTRPDGKLRLYWWQAEMDGGTDIHATLASIQPNPDEVAEARWVTPSEFEQLHPLLDSNLTFLAHFRKSSNGSRPSPSRPESPDHGTV